jgi:murein DD-endopeptidase MepM/ murein hydrolase activator NlpD
MGGTWGIWIAVCLTACAVGCGGSRFARPPLAGPPLARLPSSQRPAARAEHLRLAASRTLAIPRVESPRPAITGEPLALAPAGRAPARLRPNGAPRFAWPLSGQVTSAYGRRGRRNHDGIDIAAARGTAVRAAADGWVAYVGALRGYGRMIIVRHAAGFATVYAHNALQHVRAGALVRRGDLIATVGRSGRTTGPNLHFEVRRDDVAYDPLGFLPPPDGRMARGD